MLRTAESAFYQKTQRTAGAGIHFIKTNMGRHAALPAVKEIPAFRGYPAFFLSLSSHSNRGVKSMQSFFKKLPRYSLRLLLAYLVYIFTGGVLAYLLPRQARNLPQTDSFYGIGRGPDRAVLVEDPQDAFARRVEVIRTAQSTLDVCYHCVEKRRDYGVHFSQNC